MIDWTEIHDGDTWELFARDFLSEMDFVIEVGPGRGADAGKDLLVSEQLKGKLSTRRFKWLVSCKHFALSGKSVGPDVEANITDRLRHHKADGFLGFYSTLPSSGLVERLKSYEESGDVAAYSIFDAKRIEGQFVTTGLSKLALRYFPLSYGKMRPIQNILGKRVELRCEICDADVLERSVLEPMSSNLVWSVATDGIPPKYRSLHLVCKGECDKTLEKRLFAKGLITHWEDVGDLCNPIFYLKNALTYMNMLKTDPGQFADEAHDRMKTVYVALAQRTLREATMEDTDRFRDLSILDGFGV